MSEHQNGTPPEAPPHPRVIFEFDPVTGSCGWKEEGMGFPLPLLVNILEMAKASFVMRQFQQAQQQAPQKPDIILPNGPLPPFRRRPAP